jgi:hypothetical protein
MCEGDRHTHTEKKEADKTVCIPTVRQGIMGRWRIFWNEIGKYVLVYKCD